MIVRAVLLYVDCTTHVLLVIKWIRLAGVLITLSSIHVIMPWEQRPLLRNKRKAHDRNRGKISFNDQGTALKLSAKVNYDRCTIFDENLVAIHRRKKAGV